MAEKSAEQLRVEAHQKQANEARHAEEARRKALKSAQKNAEATAQRPLVVSG